MKTNLGKLKISPFHSKVYQTNDIEDLVESIKELGLLEKIIVKSDMTIISGVRRFLALEKLGITETDVEIKDVQEEDENLVVISHNKHRIKTNREKLNEARYLKMIWRQRRGRKSEAEKLQIDANEKPVDTRKDICEVLGLSAGNLVKLEFIDTCRPGLIDEIDKGNISINQAHNFLVKQEVKKNVIDLSANLPEDISNDYYKIVNKSSDDLTDIADETVQMVFTSPPYWQKRVFTNDPNELGAEKHCEEFVQRMATHLHACHRVLKPEGSFFLNLGDSFLEKRLMSIPHRIQIELSKKGWILRNTIVWKKTNPLPSAVRDNLTPSYEFIFHFVKSKQYLYNEILVPLNSDSKLKLHEINRKGAKEQIIDYSKICVPGLRGGKKLEDFWTGDIVSTATANQAAVKKFGGTDHPAPYPSDICILPILQTTNPGDIVLDVFSGSGTTGEISLLLGRRYIGYELNPNYNKLQVARLDDAIVRYNQEELKKAA